MEKGDKGAIFQHFANIEDPRALDKRRKHNLLDIIIITICGVICGAEDWVSIADFGKEKREWFSKFLELSHGIPSHDTFRRVFSLLNPNKFGEAFIGWVSALSEASKGDIVAIDGKTLRRSLDSNRDLPPIHMVSAWSAKNQMVLGQLKVANKSNEIIAIPKLLELLDLRGTIVTIDAMGCQKQIAETIRGQEADYVLALKANHKDLFEDIKLHFKTQKDTDFSLSNNTFHETTDADHGRIETRRYYVTNNIAWTGAAAVWKDLQSIAMVEATREIKGITSCETRFFLSSLPPDAREFARAIRTHWQIENSLHWILDVAFREDESRARAGNSAQNLSTIRRIALNLLKKENSAKLGVKNKRLKAGWSESYLLKVLAAGA